MLSSKQSEIFFGSIDPALLREEQQQVWLLETAYGENGSMEPHLIYASQEDMLADNLRTTWTLIDSDVCEGSYGEIRMYATPWPVHSFK